MWAQSLQVPGSRAQAHSSWDPWVYLPHSTWDLHGPGIEPVFPELLKDSLPLSHQGNPQLPFLIDWQRVLRDQY